MNRTELREAFEDTLSLCGQQDSEFAYRSRLEFYKLWEHLPLQSAQRQRPPAFSVTDKSCIEDCILLHEAHPEAKILLVASASATHRGGGVTKGANAQEESICRSTNLFPALEPVEYPVYGKYRGIYAPNVALFKGDDMEMIADPFQLDVICVFPCPFRKINPSDIPEHDDNIWDTVIYAAREHAVDYVVAVPVGCGVFGHDANRVAQVASIKFRTTAHNDALREVVFSCHNHADNFEKFSYIFD